MNELLINAEKTIDGPCCGREFAKLHGISVSSYHSSSSSEDDMNAENNSPPKSPDVINSRKDGMKISNSHILDKASPDDTPLNKKDTATGNIVTVD